MNLAPTLLSATLVSSYLIATSDFFSLFPLYSCLCSPRSYPLCSETHLPHFWYLAVLFKCLWLSGSPFCAPCREMNLGWLNGLFSKERPISPGLPGLSEAVCTAENHEIQSSLSLGFHRRLQKGKDWMTRERNWSGSPINWGDTGCVRVCWQPVAMLECSGDRGSTKTKDCNKANCEWWWDGEVEVFFYYCLPCCAFGYVTGGQQNICVRQGRWRTLENARW